MKSMTLRAAAFAALGFAAISGLSACEERPYSVPVRQASAPPVRSTVLDGAPTVEAPAYSSAPVETTTTVAAGPGYASAPPPSYEPPASDAPPPPQTYRPAPAYDTGGPMIVAMAPIPNPVETPRSYGHARSHGVHHVYARLAHGYAPTHRVASVAKPKAVGAVKPTSATAKAAPAKATTKTYAKAASAPAKSTQTVKKVVTTTSQTVVADAKALGAKAKTVVATPLAKGAAPAAASRTNTQAASDRTTLLAALQSALTDAVSKSAVLTEPAGFAANQPTDVSLTLPADFADTLHKAADGQTLSDAAASVNMTSLLAGDGFAVTPSDTQSQPLTVGQPTQFHWTVTAQPGAKGPLHADVGADLLGAGSDTLSLGTVQKGAGTPMKLSPQVIGAGLLALIVLLVLGWLARGRSTPARAAAARRAGRRARDVGFDRPLDMTEEPEVRS